MFFESFCPSSDGCFERTRTRTAAAAGIIFTLAAHLYRWMNTMFTHDSLLIHQHDSVWQISLGRIFNPLYVYLRGRITAPFLVGLLAGVFLILSVILIVRILDLRSRVSIVLCAGLLVTFETIAYVNAGFLLSLDLDMLALLFASSAAYFLTRSRARFRYPAAAVCVLLALGLFQSYLEVTVTLILLALLRDLVWAGEARDTFFRGLRAVLAIAAGGVLYLICLKIVWSATGIAAADTYNGLVQMTRIGGASVGSRLLNTWLTPFLRLRSMQMAHTDLSAAIHVILIVFSIAGVIITAVRRGISRAAAALSAVLILLFPFGCNFVWFLTNGMKHSLMTYSFSLFAAGAVMVFDTLRETAGASAPQTEAAATQAPEGEVPQASGAGQSFGAQVLRNIKRFGIPLLCGILIFNHVIFANQLYLKKHLETEAALSFMTRLVMRIEDTDGYIPAETPVLILGHIDDNPASAERPGFNYLNDIFVGTTHHLAVTYYETYDHYFRNVLGYPIRLVPKAEVEAHLDEYLSDPAINTLPVYPAAGSVAMVDGTVVVRLSEDLRPEEWRNPEP